MAQRKLEDSYKHKGLRRKLMDSLRAKGIKNEEVLRAMENIPRHFFLDEAFDKIAYEDRAFPIEDGQTISQPYTVAFQTDLIAPKKNDRILEVGTGSAYQATVLAEFGVQVFSIERSKKLFEYRKREYAFARQYPLLKFFYGDGYKGLPTYAPFDKILITCGAPELPEKLIEQLKPGGCIVAPLGGGTKQVMTRIYKGPRGGIKKPETFGNFSFVPMLGGKNS